MLRFRRLLIAAAALLTASASHAATFSRVVVFGDSLADVGNVYLATGGAVPAPPYSNGRLSDGPVWVEGLTTGLGLPALQASLAGGSGYAFGGARTGTSGSIPGIVAQVGGLYLPAHPLADPDALYVISGGLGDLRDARTVAQTNSASDVAVRQAAAQAAVSNIAAASQALYNAGARYIAISNIYDLGQTPEAELLGLVAASSDVTNRYNSELSAYMSTFGGQAGLNLYSIDLFGLFQSIRNDALTNGGAVYGINNVIAPCAGFPGSIGAPCATSLFSDALHPTAAAHQLIASYALNVVDPQPAGVPEPQVWALMIGGFGAIGLLSRRRRRGAEA